MFSGNMSNAKLEIDFKTDLPVTTSSNCVCECVCPQHVDIVLGSSLPSTQFFLVVLCAMFRPLNLSICLQHRTLTHRDGRIKNLDNTVNRKKSF